MRTLKEKEQEEDPRELKTKRIKCNNKVIVNKT
jgi:hypothetical protein